MRAFVGLVIRNVKVYLKDRQAVFFSLLTPIIVLGLYILFLRGTFVDALNNGLGEYKDAVGASDVNAFANLLLLSGVIGSSVITVSYSSIVTIVDDKSRKIDYDISATPINRVVIILAYLAAGFICAFLVTAVLLTGALIIVSCIGNTYLSVLDWLALYGITALGSLSAVTFLLMIVMLFKTPSTAGAFQGLLCAGAGFVIGAYIPISEFSTPVQTICNIFPASHITSIFRDILLSGVIEHMNTTIGGELGLGITQGLADAFSVKVNMFGSLLPQYVSIIYTCGFIVVSGALLSLEYAKLYKRN